MSVWRIAVLVCAAPLWADDQLLKWMDRIAQEQLSKREAAVARIQTVAEAEARQQAVRAKILELIGGLPDYSGPLNAKITGRIEMPRYVIEKVIFESLPKVFVAANVYRPKESGRYPGVLMPLGHWMEGKPAVQDIAANLAMKGFVVLAFDPLGQGERLQAYDARLRASLAGGATDQHILAGAQSVLMGASFARYRIWDAKRALDYLVSRPDVEIGKIGCTGCSGGGTLTAYISALDPRIKVAAPSCYMNTFRLLFSGPTGDSEQTIPGFLAAGLDVADYVELFAPKPYLISSTVGDFFPIEGARHAYQEARNWYHLYGAEDKVQWAIGPGGHGTPHEVRERIYEWMIRWLKDGHGDFHEEPIQPQPDFKLFATEAGQVGGRDIYEVIGEEFRRKQSTGTQEQMLAEIRKWAQTGEQKPPASRVLSESDGADFKMQQLAIEVEPGLEIPASLAIPAARGRKPAVLVVNGDAETAAKLARRGAIALSLAPRADSSARNDSRRLIGDWVTNTRAWLIGRNLPGMRAADIIRGVDLLAARPDVNAASISAAAHDVAGVWLLMAAALDPRIGKIWLHRTPYSLRTALNSPIHRNLHDALIPGFALKWDLADLKQALGTRPVTWTDPTDWMGTVVPNVDGCVYRTFEEPDDRFWGMLLR
jgi:cephalosporin-C deacetylase-like acetyl esterase